MMEPDVAVAMDGSHERSAPGLTDPLRKVPLIHRVLCEAYGRPADHVDGLDPLSELVACLLGHRVASPDGGQAFRELRSRFPSWEAVRDAPVEEVQAAIVGVTGPERRATRLQQVLRLISDIRGELSLDFLGEMAVTEARDWLEDLPGVDTTTSAAVLSFSRLRRRALPVDAHSHRVATRLGLIPPHLDVPAAHAALESQLPEAWTPRDVYDNHEVLVLHGRHCCFVQNPACHRCPIRAFCVYGQSREALRDGEVRML